MNLELKLAIEEKKRLIIEREREREREQKDIWSSNCRFFYPSAYSGNLHVVW